MTPKRFLFKLDGEELDVPPVNWESFSPLFERDPFYRGLFVSYPSKDLILSKDGKIKLDEIFNNSGIEQDVTFTIELINNSYGYDLFYTSLIDFESYDGSSETETIAGLKNTSIVSRFKERDKDKVNLQSLTDKEGNSIIPFVNETFQTTLPTQLIKKDVSYFSGSGNRETVTEDPLAANDTAYYSFNPRLQTDEDRNDLETDYLEVTNTISPLLPEINIRVTETGTLTVSIDCNIGIVLSGPYTSTLAPTAELIVKLNDQAENALANTVFPVSDLGASVEQTLSFNGSISFPDLVIGDAISVYVKFTQLNGPLRPQVNATIFATTFGQPIFNNPADFLVTYSQDTSYVNTNADFMYAWEFWLRLFQSVTGVNDPIRSTLFQRTDGEVFQGPDGDGAYLGITIGYNIRGYSISEFPITTTIREAFQAFNGTHLGPIGIGYDPSENKILIERLEFFYDNSLEIASLTDARNIGPIPNLDFLYTEVLVGDRFYKIESGGTLLSPNAEKSYTVSTKNRSSNKYDIRNPYITNGIVIETLRRDRDLGSGRDNRYDEKLIIVQFLNESTTPETGADLFQVNNIENSDEMYNLRLAPAQVVNAHLQYISAGIYSVGGPERILFISGAANTTAEIQVTNSDPLLSENQNFTPTEPIYTAITREFTYPVTRQQLFDLIASNGFITVQDGQGNPAVKGFVNNIKVDKYITGVFQINQVYE